MKQKIIISLFSILILFNSCSKKVLKVYKYSFPSMSTTVTVLITTDDSLKANSSFKIIENIFNYINSIASDYDSNSVLFKFNQNPLTELCIGKELKEIILLSDSVNTITKGYFDPTIKLLKQLWKFDTGSHPVPSSDSIKMLVELCDWKRLNMIYKKDSLCISGKNEYTKLDFGGIAKGYAIQAGIDTLKKSGIKGALIDAGGDIGAFGFKPERTLWKIGLKHPRNNKNNILAAFELKNCFVATSGDYEQFFEWNGVRYHHILNPFTGYPSKDLVSVSVFSNSGAISDALATALLAMDEKSALDWINKDNYSGFIIIDKNLKIIKSKNLNSFVSSLQIFSD